MSHGYLGDVKPHKNKDEDQPGSITEYGSSLLRVTGFESLSPLSRRRVRGYGSEALRCIPSCCVKPMAYPFQLWQTHSLPSPEEL